MKKISLNLNLFISQKNTNIFSRIFKKKNIINKDYIKSILTNNFKVKNLKSSDVLMLSFTSNNPNISQLALTNIINSYQRYEVDSKIDITSPTRTQKLKRD